MKKENELIKALLEVVALAREKGIRIRAIELNSFWYEPLEGTTPRRLLGVDIDHYRDHLEGHRA